MLTLAVLALTACSSASETLTEQIIESGGGGNVDVDIDDETVTMSFEDEEGSGELTIGGGEIPAGFPVPVPDGGEVLSVFESEGNVGATVLYDVDRYDELVAFYEEWVAGADLGELQTSSTEFEGLQSSQWFSPTAGTFISVSESADGVLVTINVSS